MKNLILVIAAFSAFAQIASATEIDPQSPSFRQCNFTKATKLEITNGQLSLTTTIGDSIKANLSHPQIESEAVYPNEDSLQPSGTQPVYIYTDGNIQVRLSKTQRGLSGQYNVMILKNGVNVLQSYCFLP